LALFQRLYEKMRREMGKRHIQRTEYGWQPTRQDSLVGRIESDLTAEGPSRSRNFLDEWTAFVTTPRPSVTGPS
jgi:hypothetical protein